LAVTLASVPAASRAAEPIDIDVIMPMTGQVAFIGQVASQTIKAVEDSVNKSGGIAGRPVRFVIHDDASNAQTTVQLVDGVRASGAKLILGPAFASSCGASLPLLQGGPLSYCFSPGVHPPAGSFMFSADWSTTDTIRTLVRYAREKGWRRVALLASTSASGQDGERGVDAALALPENSGSTLVAREHFGDTDISVAAQLTRIKASNPQVVIVWASGTPFVTAVRGVNDAGIDLPVIASNSNLTYTLMHGLAGFLPKELLFPGMVTEAYLPLMRRGAERTAVETYLTTLKALGLRPDAGAFLSWDAANIYVAALKQLGPDATADQIRQYIANLHDWVGIHGTYDFRAVPQRGLDASGVVIVHWSPVRDTWVPVSKPGGSPL
jgi:branched-chain amino acid transport system substrate-binding protein